jgi:uncharacterized membrane protein YqjE
MVKLIRRAVAAFRRVNELTRHADPAVAAMSSAAVVFTVFTAMSFIVLVVLGAVYVTFHYPVTLAVYPFLAALAVQLSLKLADEVGDD